MDDAQLDLELNARLFDARRATSVSWGRERQDAAARGLQERVRRRRQRRTAAAAVGVVALAGGLVAGVLRHNDAVAWREPRQSAGVVLPLGSASTVTVERDGTIISRRDEDDDSVVVDVRAGVARFAFEPARRRHLTVTAGPVRVDVGGTIFRVERLTAGARVMVDSGGARVSWPGGAAFVPAGSEGVFPPPAPTVAPPTPVPSSPEAPAAAAAPAGASRVFPLAVRAPAGAEALMAGADEARAAGDEARAADLLARLVQTHPKDARAPLAAFARGRLLLEKLGRAHDAAAAFRTARRLAPRGPLAEDALAREAEALGRAGDVDGAAARVAEYRRLYPGGRWLSALERAEHGGSGR